MEHVVDARGLACPLPLVKARAALERIADDEVLVVLATDPESPIDIGGLAADRGRALQVAQEGAVWRLTLAPARPAP